MTRLRLILFATSLEQLKPLCSDCNTPAFQCREHSHESESGKNGMDINSSRCVHCRQCGAHWSVRIDIRISQ